jgi:FKBP-type peptidyl-prolyl cis-trans isomerase
MKLTMGLLVVVIPFILSSCNLNNDSNIPDFDEQLQKDVAAIDSYLASNNITAVQDSSGVRYVIHTATALKKPTLDSCVTSNYLGKLLLDGSKFDEGVNASFRLGQVIEGWQIAIPFLHEGDSATLYIPSGLAYGYYGYPPAIPGNSNLIFNVGIVKVGSLYKSSDRSCN